MFSMTICYAELEELHQLTSLVLQETLQGCGDPR